MRKVLITLAIASAAVVATPAAAQRYGGYGQHQAQGAQIQRDINQLENRIQRSVRNGRISRREAVSLSRQANGLERDFYRFARNGLDRGEIRNLQVRIDRLEGQLRHERRDRDRRRY